MGYGTGSGDITNTTFFRINGLKKGSTPEELYFKGQKHDGKEYVDIDEKPTFIEGTLKEVTPRSFEYEGRTIRSFKVVLEDFDGRYSLDTGFSSLGVNILNTLAAADNIGKVKLSLYTNKKGYPSIFVSLNDSSELPKWKWTFEELDKKVEKITNKKKEVVSTDRTELEEFLVAYISSDEFKSKITDNIEVNSPEVVDDSEPNDLPFD